ncbi:MAG TPA: hypothetical protein VFG10_10380 [Saprospiraceae bacterium]|nr:hypothetical protein [Saprospiraceae bacterium]
MNSALRVVYLALIFSLIYLNTGHSQARFNLKTGVQTWSIMDEINLGGESHHSGQTVGFDMHIMSNRFIFAPGFHYNRISVLNQPEGFQYSFHKRNHLHYFNIPLTAGYELFDFKVVDLSIMAGAEAFFFYNLDSNDIGLKVDEMYGVTPALTGVIQAEIFSLITLDIKYHHALHELIRERTESKLRGFSFDLGIIF